MGIESAEPPRALAQVPDQVAGRIRADAHRSAAVFDRTIQVSVREPGTAPGVGSAALRAARVGRARFDAQHVDVDQAGVVSVELDAVDDRPPHRAGDLPRRGER